MHPSKNPYSSAANATKFVFLVNLEPLLKNKPELVEYANTKVYALLKAEFGRVAWDDNGAWTAFLDRLSNKPSLLMEGRIEIPRFLPMRQKRVPITESVRIRSRVVSVFP